jgi:hypothetical protein
MDQAVLVKNDRDIGAQVIEALNRRKIPVTLWEWVYVPQLEEQQMIIASPWYDSKGPQTTYRALVDALQRAGIYEKVPMRRLFIKSPADPLVKALDREAKEQIQGTVHILKHGSEYSLLFAAITNTGVRRFSTAADLKRFLVEELRLKASSIDDAFDEVKRSGAGSIYPVMLTSRDVRRLGLI